MVSDGVITDSLPRRPRVLPGLAVLLRRPGEIQVGTDPRHAVVIDGLPPAFIDELLDLDGRHTITELGERVRARGENADDLLDLLSRLRAAGLVEESTGVPPALAADATSWTLRTGHPTYGIAEAREHACVVVHGDGRLAVATASLLAASGVGRVQVVAGGAVGPQDTGCGYLVSDIGRPRREAAAEAIRRASSTTRLKPGVPDVVVLADAMVTRPDLVGELMTERVPHLAVRVREGVGLVGPLVLPGRTSCLRCADLHRADRDPCWPAVAAQLVDRPQPADLIAASATAALAVGQVLLALGLNRVVQTSPSAVNTTIEIDPLRGIVDRRTWHPHPSCECGSAVAHNMVE
jgi:bacteriocin biosynthesis cyclodehydratase domain-containing protein